MTLNDIKKIDKPWGYELLWAVTEKYVGKILFIKKGHSLSLQYHKTKDETIILQEGRILLEIHDKKGGINEIIMTADKSYRVTPFTKHRMKALEDSKVFEVSTPEIDDIVRITDDYGRV
jgi:mannose-6-phosphate isomerase